MSITNKLESPIFFRLRAMEGTTTSKARFLSKRVGSIQLSSDDSDEESIIDWTISHTGCQLWRGSFLWRKVDALPAVSSRVILGTMASNSFVRLTLEPTKRERNLELLSGRHVDTYFAARFPPAEHRRFWFVDANQLLFWNYILSQEQHERITASSHVHDFLSNTSSHAHNGDAEILTSRLTSVNQKRLRFKPPPPPPLIFALKWQYGRNVEWMVELENSRKPITGQQLSTRFGVRILPHWPGENELRLQFISNEKAS